MKHRLVLFGGNGFVGSAIARQAVLRGWAVTSFSRSGRAWTSPAGHTPAWVTEVDWRRGSPFERATYAETLPSATALVSTLGLLFEGRPYKRPDGSLDPLALVRRAFGREDANPLVRSSADERSYARMNRDAAIEAFRALRASRTTDTARSAAPFVFISAADVFAPLVPRGYIDSKRAAETVIGREAAEPGAGRPVRPVFVRPGLIYHPHTNPSSTLAAAMMELTATVSERALPRAIAEAVVPPIARARPCHVDHVAEAVCDAIERDEIEGVLDPRLYAANRSADRAGA